MSEGESPRVFHLITRLIKGGAEAKTTATVLGLDGYEFTVGYGASYDQKPVDRFERNGVETKRFPMMRHYNPITAVPATISLANYLCRKDFDIVHTHSTEAGIIGRFAAALAGVSNVVHTVHGVPFTEDRNRVLNRFVLYCERIAAKSTDTIITNADVIATEYLTRGIGSKEQYTTVYSGIRLDEFREATPATNLPGARPRIVMVGRLAEGKGFELLVEAAADLCDSNVSVCLVGDGPLYESLVNDIEQRGLSDSVFLTGYRNDVPRILAASDVLVLPSFREGTPRVITEAMASGLPVVATNIAGIPEQVADSESGFLIPTGDVDALSDRLEELLEIPELRESMAERAQNRVERFSEEKMIADIRTVYDSLLAK